MRSRWHNDTHASYVASGAPRGVVSVRVSRVIAATERWGWWVETGSLTATGNRTHATRNGAKAAAMAVARRLSR